MKTLSLREIPVKNIKAHPVRCLILMALTIIQAACVFGAFMMGQGMRQELKLSEARLGADLLVYPTAAVSRISAKKLLMQGTPVEVYRDRSMLEKMKYCENIEAVSYQIYISDVTEDGRKVWIVGYEPETDFVISPWLEKGSDIRVPRGSVAAGSRVEVQGNNSVRLYGKDWQVEAALMETGSYLDEAVFVPVETLKDMIDAARAAGRDDYASLNPGSDFSAALVRVTDRERVGSAADWINIYVRKVTAVRSEETLTQAASGIQGTIQSIKAVSILAYILLLSALGITHSMLMKERIKEVHVWRCIGAYRGIINRLMMTEALIVHLAGAAAGALLSAAVFALQGRRLIVGAAPAAGSLLAAGVISILTAVIGGMAAAYISSRAVTGG